MPAKARKTNKRGKRRNARRRTGALSRPFALYPSIPTSMKLCLRGRTYETATASSSPFFYKYGLVEFLNLGGSYVDTFLYGGLYRNAIVHANRITVKYVNMGSEPVILACAALPYSWSSGSPTLSELLDHPTAVRKHVSAYSGMDKAQIVNHASVKEVLGKDYQASKYQMDYAQATSTTPISAAEPVWVVTISAFNALTAISFRMEVEVDWNVEFFNLDSF